MKSIVSGLLLLLLVLQSGGFMVCFLIQQEMIREEMREELLREDAGLVSLRMTSAEFASCRVDEREIRYRGCMYDIRTVERKGELMEVRALRDHKEESLFGSFKKLIHHSRDVNGRIGSGVVLLSFISYLQGKSAVPVPAELKMLCASLQRIVKVGLIFFSEVPAPPPDKVLFFSL